MKRFQWLPHDRYSIRLIGIQYRSRHVRVLHVGLWFGEFRWELDS